MNKLRRRRTRAQQKPMSPLMRLLRIVVVIAVPLVGISLIAATISALFSRPAPPPQAAPEPEAVVQTIALKQEITPLTTAIKALVPKELNLHLMVYEPDQGGYVDINAATPTASASLIAATISALFSRPPPPPPPPPPTPTRGRQTGPPPRKNPP
ncbi:MAG: hypothetical protein LDL47_08265, partial [Cyanobacteria bacterium KgW148]|nr:hypothetical protein [Cyanobacteria bacterium KgW148]